MSTSVSSSTASVSSTSAARVPTTSLEGHLMATSMTQKERDMYFGSEEGMRRLCKERLGMSDEVCNWQFAEPIFRKQMAAYLAQRKNMDDFAKTYSLHASPVSEADIQKVSAALHELSLQESTKAQNTPDSALREQHIARASSYSAASQAISGASAITAASLRGGPVATLRRSIQLIDPEHLCENPTCIIVAEKVKKCARCCGVQYCDKPCQTADWKRHKGSCKPSSSSSSSSSSSKDSSLSTASSSTSSSSSSSSAH